MGAYAYRRGTRALSISIRRDFGLEVPEDRPAPERRRPDGWGDAARERAIKFARGWLSYAARKGIEVTAAELVDVFRHQREPLFLGRRRPLSLNEQHHELHGISFLFIPWSNGDGPDRQARPGRWSSVRRSSVRRSSVVGRRSVVNGHQLTTNDLTTND